MESYIESFNKPHYKITAEEYFAKCPLTKKISKKNESNLQLLLDVVNKIRLEYGSPLIVSSGWRSPEYNKKIGGATNSLHTSFQAIDISDPFGNFKRFLLKNDFEVCKQHNIYVEHFAYTNGWVHIQTIPPRSGLIHFRPYAGAPKPQYLDKDFISI